MRAPDLRLPGSLLSFALASSGCGLVSILIAGCYMAHSRGGLDASVEGDATAVRPGDAAPDAPARCSGPVSDWPLVSVELDGRWREVRLARDGESRWLIAQPIDGGAIHALELDPSSASPEPRGDVELQGTEGSELVAADGDRVRIAVLTRPPALHVHNPSGARLSVADATFGADMYPSIALRGARIGLVIHRLSVDAGLVGLRSSEILAEVRDVAGGPPISSTVLEGWGDGGVAEGRGLFAVLASEGHEASTHIFDLDERGVVRAEAVGAWIRFRQADGSTFAGFGLGAPGLRHPDGRTEAFDLPPPGRGLYYGPTVAVGPLGTIAAIRSAAGLWLAIDGEWVSIGDDDSPSYAYADQAARRAGAFFLDGEILRWAGLTCDD